MKHREGILTLSFVVSLLGLFYSGLLVSLTHGITIARASMTLAFILCGALLAFTTSVPWEES